MSLRLMDGAAYNSGQWPNNVDWTHLVLASGKLVLQKKIKKPTMNQHWLCSQSNFSSSCCVLTSNAFWCRLSCFFLSIRLAQSKLLSLCPPTLSSAIDESWQHQNFWEHWESNPRQLSDKGKSCLCAMPPSPRSIYSFINEAFTSAANVSQRKK